MLRPFGLSAVTGILLIAEKKRKKCRWINRKLFLDGKEMDGCLKSISGVAASVMVGGLLTRVADDARKIDDPHLMCEKVIHFETCTFVYYIPTLVTYSFFLPAVWLGPPRSVLIGWSATRPLPLFVCLTCCGLRNALGKKKEIFVLDERGFSIILK
jgi:hypothetical protein